MRKFALTNTNMEKEKLIKDLIGASDSNGSDEIIDSLRPFFHAEHPEVLDDDIEEAFDRWLNQEVEYVQNLLDLKARANDDE